ncbi:MAG TPA: triose-phosphate isomerase [Gammaproteobacteria bacterium]|nr:triose-phosphate isomerase [Gammaproteobacteria bacterium]
MRTPLVVGNWKMHGSRAMAAALCDEIKAARGEFAGMDVGVCPPYVLLPQVADSLRGSGIAWGAQDVSEQASGAYTGEVSAAMLKDFDASLVIVGHSERRALYGDTDALTVKKLRQAEAVGLVPILCVGETLEERKAGRTEAVVARQLDALLGEPDAATLLGALVIAYEPVWAIGTGETATPDQAQAVHAFIRARLGSAAAGIRLLYGGSVKPGNAGELFAMPDIDGGLIGGAALKSADFIAICSAARGRTARR